MKEHEVEERPEACETEDSITINLFYWVIYQKVVSSQEYSRQYSKSHIRSWEYALDETFIDLHFSLFRFLSCKKGLLKLFLKLFLDFGVKLVIGA